MFFVIEGKVEKLVFHNQERQKNHEMGPTFGGIKIDATCGWYVCILFVGFNRGHYITDFFFGESLDRNLW